LLRVGLTGGIACGKTRVRERLAARGCATLDLDQSAREAVRPGSPALREIEAAFGASAIKDGALDRAALAALVFADKAARERLNAIVHPRVRELEAAWAAAQPQAAVQVTDAALLVETGAHLRYDRLVVVHCAPELQLARLRARDGLDERAARARIEAQMPLAEKRAFAHFAVDTSAALDDTDRAADGLCEELRALSERRPREADVPLTRLLGALVHGPLIGPRGLTPEKLLRAAASAGNLELGSLAAQLEPKASGAWYETAREAEPRAAAANLAPALAAWALASRPPDADFLASAAASLARLTHVDAASRAEACLFALLLQEVSLVGRVPQDLEARARAYAAAAERWGGGAPGGALAPVLQTALAHPGDPAAASAAAAERGAPGELASALVGAARGAGARDAPALAASLEAIRASS
jgi:dephospho-CoA kinase